MKSSVTRVIRDEELIQLLFQFCHMLQYSKFLREKEIGIVADIKIEEFNTMMSGCDLMFEAALQALGISEERAVECVCELSAKDLENGVYKFIDIVANFKQHNGIWTRLHEASRMGLAKEISTRADIPPEIRREAAATLELMMDLQRASNSQKEDA
jgi:hypothetical protein